MNASKTTNTVAGVSEGTVDPVFQICNTQTVLNRIPFTELETWVNEPLSDDIHCLDIEDPSRKRPSDDQVWRMIIEKSGIRNASAFQQLNEDVRRRVLSELKEQGASHRQLERLTGVGRGLIQKL